MKIKIRKAQAQDTKLILRLIKELAKYERLFHEVVADEDSLHSSLFSSDPEAYVLIAELDEKAVGFALYFYTFSTFLGKSGIHLEDLFVIEEYRGNGVGKLLLGELAKIALNENKGRLEWAVLDWNTPAIEFYKSIGAKAMQEWFTFRMTEKELKEFVNT